jgi:hypothetical protein
LSNKVTKTEFLQEIVAIFYQVGLVGIKPEPHLGRQWSFEDDPTLDRAQVKPQAQIDTSFLGGAWLKSLAESGERKILIGSWSSRRCTKSG